MHTIAIEEEDLDGEVSDVPFRVPRSAGLTQRTSNLSMKLVMAALSPVRCLEGAMVQCNAGG